MESRIIFCLLIVFVSTVNGKAVALSNKPTIDPRVPCNVIFWLDASNEAWAHFGTQTNLLKDFAALAFIKYSNANFLLRFGLSVLGQDQSPDMGTFCNTYDQFATYLNGFEHDAALEYATGDTIKNTIDTANRVTFLKNSMLFFFTNSNQAEVDAAATNQKRANITRVANPLSSDNFPGALEGVIEQFCQNINAM
ncbi:unnamed protein product, partial [Mesorhabditis spiculigera]